MDLTKLINAYESGDEMARQAVLERLELRVRTAVRLAMGKELRLDRDSSDVCQSVLLVFHLHAKDGRVAFDNQQALNGYIRTLVRNVLANLSDRVRAVKRGGGARPIPLETGMDAPAPDLTASTYARAAELRSRIDQLLTPEEQAILEGRMAGCTNAELAVGLDKNEDAVRMTWSRAAAKLRARGFAPEN